MQEKEKIRLQELAHKYLNGTLTSAEQFEFDHWFEQSVDEPLTIPFHKKVTEKTHKAEIFASIQKELKFTERKTYRIWPRVLVAASLLLCTTVALYFYFHTSPLPVLALSKSAKPIQPGGNKAYLTLANGRRLALTDASNGALAKESGVQISKTADGQLIYTIADDQQKESPGGYNTVETPRGGQYQIRLPDGTQVWLNSASTLKYPVCFTAKATREVKLQGEAYFEVAKNKNVPFIVEVQDKQKVKVLGTHFNIKAYIDEPALETTLLEGSVEVSNTFQKNTLKPGQQASLQDNKHFIISDNIDLKSVVAWKNGQILFADQDIKSIMRQISRWYDVDVEYRGNIPERSFNGGFSKSSNLEEILKILELSHIHFKTEGRKLIVTP
ncbi:FecR family protein [Pedobacter sp.]|jgi:transmembrane sensor|uniref:FecR family protein n=1 Tax=Pedobacter sp. TaxID=1411316 RepID=UPI002CD37CDD|nr:FecR family protein [Pedobacter sp.]HWW39421.1 FecR family protein [Pedobacter sp.]